MRLTIVGCSGSYPSGSSPASCYLIEHDGRRLVLDMGNGSLGALHNHLDPIAADAFEAVILSHCHIDHCADLASLFVARYHYGPRDLPTLMVLGPSDTSSRLAAICGMSDPALIRASFDVRDHVESVTIGPFTIETALASHPVEAYSIKVTAGGRSVTYSGDTGPTDALATLADGTDIALFEGSFVGDDNPVDLHMSGADAGSIAAASNAALLILTHLVAHNDDDQVLAEARSQFSGRIELARPGLSITL